MSSPLIPTNFWETLCKRENNVSRTDDQRRSMDAKSVTEKHDKAGKRLVKSFLNALAGVGESYS